MGNRIKALVIEDSPGVRAIVSKFLGLIGVTEYDTASNGLVGVQKAFLLRPDIIILDEQMPGLDGLETMFTIRSFLPDAVIIISSASNTDSDNDRYLNAGADFSLPKPFNKEMLASVISQASALKQVRTMSVS